MLQNYAVASNGIPFDAAALFMLYFYTNTFYTSIGKKLEIPCHVVAMCVSLGVQQYYAILMQVS